MIEQLYTIGGYGFGEKGFFDALLKNDVDVFCDVRQRRGMRGSQFAFLNSEKLQERLRSLGIAYVHLKDFAPTNEIRDEQKRADARAGVQKRLREGLGVEFVEGYRSKILANLTPDAFFSALSNDCKRPTLFCVERAPCACHRSLMAQWISDRSEVRITNILP